MMRLLPLGLLLLALTAGVPASPAAAETQPADDWTLELSASGAEIAYRGVPVIFDYGTNVVQPGWAGVIAKSTGQKFSTTRSDDGRTIVATAQSRDYQFRYELTRLSPTMVRFGFRGTLLTDQPAMVEHSFGRFNANLIANRGYHMTGPGIAAQRGTIPAHPASNERKDTHLPEGFRTLSFDSRLGPVTLAFDAPDNVTFKDGRFGPVGWSRNEPTFWMGFSSRVKQGEPLGASMVLTVDPRTPWPTGEAVNVAASATADDRAFEPEDHGMLVIPKPKSLNAGDGRFTLEDAGWTIAQPEEDGRLGRALTRILHGEHGLPRPTLDEPRADDGGVRITAGQPGDVPSGEWEHHDEGYALRVTERGVLIASKQPRGAFNGLQTLAQLIKTDDQGRPYLPAVTVEDWPSLAHRSVHWYPSAKGVEFHRRTIERIFARYKINASIIQCEAAHWESHPEIAARESISKQDLVALVELCRENFIEPIPLINVPGHARWIFRDGANAELAEDPDALYAYSVKDPRSYAFIFSLMEEVIEVFQPRTFHIGHDEVTMIGRFPNPEHPLYAGETLSDYLVLHLTKLNDWLNERGIEAMVWSDMFMTEAEARGDAEPGAEATREKAALRERLPDNVIMADWHYSNWERYPSLKVLQDAGFETIACTWYRPENIYYFTHRAAEAGALGLMQTTWAGWFPDESTLERELRQFSAYVLAGEYAWSLREEKPDALPYAADAVFMDAYEGAAASPAAGQRLGLAEAVNAARQNPLKLGEGWGFTEAPTGTTRLRGVRFDVPSNGLVALGGAMAPQGAASSVTLEVEAVRGREVAMLHAVAWDVTPRVDVGRVVVRFTDGQEAAFPVRANVNTAAFNTTDPAMRAPIGWQAEAPGGQPLTLRVTRFTLPDGAAAIDRIRFEAGSPATAWLVAGVTVLE